MKSSAYSDVCALNKDISRILFNVGNIKRQTLERPRKLLNLQGISLPYQRVFRPFVKCHLIAVLGCVSSPMC